MRFVDLIDKKAHGDSLTTEEIQQMVTGFVSGEIPDYQRRSEATPADIPIILSAWVISSLDIT